MQFRLRTLFFIVAATAILTALVMLIAPGPRSPLMGFKRSMQRTYDEIEAGEPKTKLVDLFGEPWSTESDFSRAIDYRQSDFSTEELSRCVEFVTWMNGGNWFYCFGIDENDKIVLKADGHS